MGLITCEEQLAHGHLLSCLGYGQADPLVSDLSLDSVFDAAENDGMETGVLPPLTSGFPTAQRMRLMSFPEASQSGSSLPSLAESIQSVSISYADEQIGIPVIQERVSRLLPWANKFSWEGSGLCFGGQPLDLIRTREDHFSKASPGSELAFSISQRSTCRFPVPISGTEEFEPSVIAGIGSFHDSDEQWIALELPQDLEVASMVCSDSSDNSGTETNVRGEFITAGKNPLVEIVYQKTIDHLVDLLIDDFFRSYPPHRTQRRSLPARNNNVDRKSGNSNKRTQRSSTRLGDIPGPCRRTAVGSDRGSEDEEFGGKGQGPSNAGKSKNPRLWACPFIKWKPERYTMCHVNLRTPSHVKDHLNKNHKQKYCEKCFLIYPDDYRGPMPMPHCCVARHHPPLLGPPVGLITDGMAAEINKRAARNTSHKEQWERYYILIFPGEPVPYNPYLTFEAEPVLHKIEKHMRSKSAQMLLDQETQDMSLGRLDRSRISELVFRRFVPRILEMLGQMQWRENHDDEPPVEQNQTIPAVEEVTSDIFTPDNTDKSALYRFESIPAAIWQYPVPIFTDIPALPEPATNQPESENLTFSGLLSMREFQDIVYSSEPKHSNSQESDAFRTPEGGNLPLFEGEDVCMTELSQTWDIEGLCKNESISQVEPISPSICFFPESI